MLPHSHARNAAIASAGKRESRSTAAACCGLSSLDMVNLMLAVEAEFDLKIPDRQMTPSNFRSIGHITKLVRDLS